MGEGLRVKTIGILEAPCLHPISIGILTPRQQRHQPHAALPFWIRARHWRLRLLRRFRPPPRVRST